jgi:hypothetical protein
VSPCARSGANQARRSHNDPPATNRGPAPFPFATIFQNGPRRPESAPPRKNRAPWTAPGRSENPPHTRERGPLCWRLQLSVSENPPTTLDHVNNLQASLQLPVSFASTAYSHRRNVRFTSPEYAACPPRHQLPPTPSFDRTSQLLPIREIAPGHSMQEQIQISPCRHCPTC